MAVIKGGGRGIGEAIAFKMVREDASISLLGILSEWLARVAEELQAQTAAELPSRTGRKQKNK